MTQDEAKYEARRRRFSILLFVLLGGVIFAAMWLQGHPAKLPHIVADNQPGTYRVSEFYDGDTIAVDMNGSTEKVRLIGVDTPETHDPRKPVQCFGLAASDFTKKLIGAQRVRLEADPTNTNRDRYNRLLRYVYLPDATLVNAKIIQEGYGFAYTFFPFEKLDEFRGYEQKARTDNKGLWGNCDIVTETNGQIHTNTAK